MTLFFIRHASAGTRGTDHDDLSRPLDAVGRDQADSIAERFESAGITRVLTSRAIRCSQTVAPLAHALSLEVEDEPALLEGQSARNAVDLCRNLARDGVSAALCSHGDIIPDAIQTLAREGMVISGQRGWAKGSTWQLDVRGGDIVQATFLGPF
jgi:8-oxo-dGTP diphosphatase